MVDKLKEEKEGTKWLMDGGSTKKKGEMVTKLEEET